MAIVMQASGIPGVDMGAASIKMNEDGSFNLLMGATDIGTGSDTMFCQVAAETLGVPVEKIIPYSSDTDMTPFDPGAYASSTTYISGRAVEKAARAVLGRSWRWGRGCSRRSRRTGPHGGKVCATDGRFVTYEQVCLSSLYQEDQFQIMAAASHMSYDSPPPFAAVFAEVEVDIETGLVRVLRVVEAVDCGQVVNPHMAEGQVEGAAMQSLGYALYERMPFDAAGRMAVPLLPRLHDRHRGGRAGDRHDPGADPRADGALRGQGDRGDPDQRPRARGGQRGLPRHRGAHPRAAADSGPGPGRPARHPEPPASR